VLYDEGYAFEALEDTLVTVWTGDPLPKRLTHMVARMNELHDQRAKGVFLFAVIRPSAGLPNPESRNLMQRQFQQMRNRLLACAVVLEKTGLEGALSRTMLSTLSTLTRQPFPLKTFAERAIAAQWLGERSAQARPSAVVALAAKLEQSLAPPRGSVRPPST
jgi:hypothetical protein